MRNIIIVEASSTGKNLVQDIINRNYNPIVLELKQVSDSPEAKEYHECLKEAYDYIQSDFELIHEKDTYEQTLEMVRQLDPKIIIPGAENGVILATRLSNDLNLMGNDIKNLDAMTLKSDMQDRLAENNLRYIRGQVITSPEEASKYYDSEGLGEVVIKPVIGAASVGVKICHDKEEMMNALGELFNKRDAYGNILSKFVIQERINGEEYIVNTVSHKGVHRVTTMWKYNKITTSEGGHIYNYMNSIDELGLGESEIVEYAYDVADAIGIEYGSVHGEYMVDENGPVLIEVNCRAMGGYMDAEYLDMLSGQHETDSILDSYLNPDKFYHELKKGYQLYGHATLKFFIVPKDLIAKSSPLHYISTRLKSHYKTSITEVNNLQPFSKTQDLETKFGTTYLFHEDARQVYRDLEFLESIENNAFQLVLSEGLDKKITLDEDKSHEDIIALINNIKSNGTCLLITDHIYDNLDILQVTPQELNHVHGEFDSVVINLNKSIIDRRDDEIAKFVLDTFDRIKVGGLVFIPKSTYDAMPSGRLGAEALVKVLDFRINLPLHHFPKILIASKRE